MGRVAYHINTKTFEHGKCSAQDITNCSFYDGKDVDESNTHYWSEEESKNQAEKLKHKRYNSFSTHTCDSFNSTKMSVGRALVSAGVFKKSSLPDVKTQSDLITKWFSGNEKCLQEFMDLSKKDDIKKSTKNSMARMLSKGLEIHQFDNINDMSASRTKNTSQSDITILSENASGMSRSDLVSMTS